MSTLGPTLGTQPHFTALYPYRSGAAGLNDYVVGTLRPINGRKFPPPATGPDAKSDREDSGIRHHCTLVWLVSG